MNKTRTKSKSKPCPRCVQDKNIWMKIKIEPGVKRAANRKVTKITGTKPMGSLKQMKLDKKKACRKLVMKKTMHNYKAGCLMFAKSAKRPKGIQVSESKTSTCNRT